MRSVTTAFDRGLALAVVLATTACEIATGGAFASGSVGVGASVGDDAPDTTSTSGDEIGKTDDGPHDTGKPGPGDDGESSTTDGDGDDTGTADDAAGTTSAATTSTGAIEDDESTGEMPAADPWSPCFGGGCGDGMVCMSVPMEQGVCTQPCMPAGDATACPPAPSGDAATSCITLQGTSYCALDCSHGADCPAGTLCRVLADDLGAIVICL